MKRLVFICILAVGVSTWAHQTFAQNSPPPSQIPFVTGITPREAPSGAVIQLNIQSDIPPGSLMKYRLAIGGVTAQFYQIYKDDWATIAAVVPYNLKIPVRPVAGSSTPVEVLFFDPQEQGGIVYHQFNVLVPTGLKGKEVEISAVRAVTENYFDITFNDYIPPELWPKVTIFFDDKDVQRIFRMSERSFTVERPPGVSTSIFNVYARVGDNETSVFKYDRFGTKPTATPTSTPVLVESPKSVSTPFILLSLLGLLAAGGLAIYFYRKSKLAPQIVPTTGPPEDAEELHLPEELPSDLVDACATGECVLYAGAGLSAQAGLPTWKDFVLGLLQWAHDSKFIDDVEAASYRAEVDRGKADPVADSIVSRLTTEDHQSALNNYLQKVFLRRSSPSELHSQVKRIKFSAVLTTNFDSLLESVYEVKSEQVYTPKDTDHLLAALTRRAFFLLKLYGRLDRKDTVMVAPAQYEDAITGNTLFSQFMETLFFSRTLLFIGASLEGIEAYLKGISLPKEVARKHYAVVAVTDRAWRATAELLERRYGIKVLPYTPWNDYAELRDFLNKLTDAVAARQEGTTGGTQKVSRLKRVTLHNIGPFEDLNLELDLGFDEKWHIFLGDNGVGKSTVLKAISLALCGKEAQHYAGRLLRDTRRDKDDPTEETIGTITLETDNKTSYVTTLRRDKRGEVELISTTARALEAEGWLAIGFPPLRTTSWDAPKGPEADLKKKSRPVVSDLLPLVSGDVDPRLDKLKQWIINLDYEDAKDLSAEGRNRELIQKLFNIIGEVAEGMKLTYKGVDKGRRILVETQDGTLIQLEGLSQGTISLIGWIGIFMQRLYEVFDEDKDPTKRYALILMDEIDAHMHPLWQRTLVNHLKEIFPNVQFIVTTHSPLLIRGMPPQQVVRFARDAHGKVTMPPLERDMTFGYTDQLLTSMLFGLKGELDDTTERKKARYYELFEMKDRTGYQDEYELLKQELMIRIPPRTATYEEKHDKQLLEVRRMKELGEKLKAVSAEGGQVLIDRAEGLRSGIEGGIKSDSN